MLFFPSDFHSMHSLYLFQFYAPRSHLDAAVSPLQTKYVLIIIEHWKPNTIFVYYREIIWRISHEVFTNFELYLKAVSPFNTTSNY